MTALAVIVSPESLLWKGLLYGGIYVLLVCAFLIFLDMRTPFRERQRMIPLIGMVVFGLAFIGCLGWYNFPRENVSHESEQPKLEPAKGPLAGLTNTQLRERALALVASMREVDKLHSDEELREMNEEFLRDRLNPVPIEERREEHIRNGSLKMQKSQKYFADFKARFRTDAVLLRDEIKVRLGGTLPDFPSDAPDKPSAINFQKNEIFQGMLVNSFGIQAGADILEYWARQLP